MSTRPAGEASPFPQETDFARQFEKDLRFFRLLFVLLNKSSPIKNVDLSWEHGEITGTTQALEDPCSRLLQCDHTNPTPRFCNIVNDHERHPVCRMSDRAAQKRVRESGRSEVYRCHAGLVDIAVPVMCDGRHIATLHSGQVLASAPTPSGFVQISDHVAKLPHVNVKELKAAYFELPVVTESDVQNTAGILEMFADYLATAYKRLHAAIEMQQRRLRELQLRRKEAGHILLEGSVSDQARLRDLCRALALEHCPNRVAIVKPQSEDRGAEQESFDVAFTRVLHAVEETCSKAGNVMAAYLRRHGICVFFFDGGENETGRGDARAYALGQRILREIGECGGMPVRIGVGRPRREWVRLAESYQEAGMALAQTQVTVAMYKKPAAAMQALSSQVEALCRMAGERRVKEARVAVRQLPGLASRHLGHGLSGLAAQRQFLMTAFESLIMAAQSAGCGDAELGGVRGDAYEAFELAGTVFDLQERWVAMADKVLGAIATLYAGRHEKLIERARGIIEGMFETHRHGSAITLVEVAARAGVSAGHLSRTFKKVTGMTFERYLMVKRVERAQRLLLDPLSRVSEVAGQCDFGNPAYFARVFRKLTGCSPTEYSKNPMRLGDR